MLSSNLAALLPLPNSAALCGRIDRIVAKAGPGEPGGGGRKNNSSPWAQNWLATALVVVSKCVDIFFQ